MTIIQTVMLRLMYDKRGITAVEYAVLAAMVGSAIMLLQGDFETALANAFTSIFTPSAS